MRAKLTVDTAGRVLLPKALREQWRLSPGATLELDTGGDPTAEAEEVRLRPVRQQAPLRKKQGVWVFQGEPLPSPPSIPEAIDRARERRLKELQGR